jgi:glycerol-3-phosphate dehydrogenase (NAD(P)+)
MKLSNKNEKGLENPKGSQRISIIGAGSWGTTLANLLAENNPDKEIILWAREKEVVESIQKESKNKLFLPNITLDGSLKATSEIKEAVETADIIVTAVPTPFLREKAKEMKPFVKENATVINVSKGLENHSFKTMTQVLKEELGNVKLVALSGPNHAEEVSRKIPTATVIASKDADLQSIKKAFETDYFKVYPHDDVIGVEICGAVKNITAIATGVISGLGLGDNASGSIITLGLREMVHLGRDFGAKEATFYGLAGVGDLVATCMSKHSRNRKTGLLLTKGLDFEKIKEEMHGQIAEGIMTCKAVHEYAVKNNVRLPLTAQVYNVLFEKKELKEAIADLKKLI